MSKYPQEVGNEWQRRSKTYRAKSLQALRSLYSAGVSATLAGQPDLGAQVKFGLPNGEGEKDVKDDKDKREATD